MMFQRTARRCHRTTRRCCSSRRPTSASRRTIPARSSSSRLEAVSRGSSPRWTCRYEVDRALWSKDGKTIYFLANMGVHAELFAMPTSGGAPRQLTDGQHTIGGWSMAGDQHVFTIDEPTNPGDVWLMTSTQIAPTRVTHVFDYLARDFELARQESIHWKGADGTHRRGPALLSCRLPAW